MSKFPQSGGYGDFRVTLSTLRHFSLVPMQVYALTTALCVASAKSTKRSSSRERAGEDEDAMLADDAIDPRDDGPSFGRLVVDGCCHAFAKALRKVCFPPLSGVVVVHLA